MQVYQEHNYFKKTFKSLSEAWRAVLARSDDELGLAPVGGAAAGVYRTLITSRLRKCAQRRRQAPTRTSIARHAGLCSCSR